MYTGADPWPGIYLIKWYTYACMQCVFTILMANKQSNFHLFGSLKPPDKKKKRVSKDPSSDLWPQRANLKSRIYCIELLRI